MLKALRITVGLAVLLFSLLPHKANAAVLDQFSTEYDISYDVGLSEETLVTQNIIITNRLNDVIATNYSITIRQMNVYDVQANDPKDKLEVSVDKKDDATTLNVKFNNYVIGEGRQNKITIQYKTKDIATKVGNVWNINIPRTQISDSTALFNVKLVVPLA